MPGLVAPALLPPGTPVPERLEGPEFTAVPLTPALAELDHEAYTGSPEVIRVHSDERWPVEGFTVAEDAGLAAAHLADHELRPSFAYLLLDPPGERALRVRLPQPAPRGPCQGGR